MDRVNIKPDFAQLSGNRDIGKVMSSFPCLDLRWLNFSFCFEECEFCLEFFLIPLLISLSMHIIICV